MNTQRPLVLIIMDGWGVGTENEHNAIFLAETPNTDHLLKTYPNTIIGAAGEFVGLTPGHQGSSEIGHLIIGAGRNVLLPQNQIKRATQDGTIAENRAYLDSLQQIKSHDGRLHIMGLLSDKGVHSYDETCHVLLRMAKKHGVPDDKIFVHVLSDGRDTSPKMVKYYVERLRSVGIGRIASIMGRYWAMDRDHRWERVEKAFNMLALGKADYSAATIDQAIDDAYSRSETDEFIKPTIILPEGVLKEHDVVWNFNYRVDREIEITQALVEPDFKHFSRNKQPTIQYIALSDYYIGIPCPVAFRRDAPRNTFGEVVSREHLTQLRCAETEKWAYVTKIFSGLREDPFPGEVRILIPSDKIPTYDLKPDMKAFEIAKEVANHLHEKSFDVYIVNFANPDILGHTGNKEAIMKGVHTVDTALGLIYSELLNVNGMMLITADHGDAEINWDHKLNQPHTAHTDSHVPFIYVDEQNTSATLREAGSLQDIAPTALHLLGIPKPKEMTGNSLII
ncbi:MAG: phosphoglycerate mutase (2,3-diphosphoglycerate-independent) [Candidatus Kerfeldbacteria bacterium RIFCSPLOWO2_01_FULL_48_11]|uniref:2,3-bisphosphoglycerate-independent phosphoglycerate mutase n=1 Tax=Candidatus Kerfeldbacteria bacterium RIFCSPLOWO2_01_FULL_48_11 TaxID=1798543 RepID=A0A1G2B417_9BACT|nr:MAG: phosphoglycerate mutase (2,3-diphosphoglycerate-independent) [Candidatus Kerfeldbacteria bacterium RIFCSPLOWO2_01_FULL_48_11]HCM68454.1 2,3-bisphosphoglycerate-independent phosphoglycerate mutase [Candidatus Kerfeldbacteria bacterium]